MLCGVVAVSEAETGGSRLSMTDRADHANDGLQESIPASRFKRLTERDGIALREEVEQFGSSPSKPVTWRAATDRFEEYLSEKGGTDMVFEDPEGNLAKGSDPHRFAEEYGDKQYAKLKDLERAVQRKYGKMLHTAMLTISASATPQGEFLPPVDHLDELLASWDAVRRALDRVLGDRRYARLAILEPHPGDGDNNGYLHIHIAVFMEGFVSASEFEPVYDAHVRNCDFAGKKAHTADNIDVRHTGLDRGELAVMNHARAEGYPYSSESIGNLACYLAEYLNTHSDPLDQPECVRASNAVLWATGRQRWRPCQQAQKFMAYDGPEQNTDWEFIGIEDASGEFHEVSEGSGGVSRFVTGSGLPPD